MDAPFRVAPKLPSGREYQFSKTEAPLRAKVSRGCYTPAFLSHVALECPVRNHPVDS